MCISAPALPIFFGVLCIKTNVRMPTVVGDTFQKYFPVRWRSDVANAEVRCGRRIKVETRDNFLQKCNQCPGGVHVHFFSWRRRRMRREPGELSRGRMGALVDV